MEFIEPGFHRKKYLYLWSARNVLGDILSVSKPGDVKQLDARIQNLLCLTSGGGVWRRPERRGMIPGSCGEL